MKPSRSAVLYGTGLLLAFGAGWVGKAFFTVEAAPLAAGSQLSRHPISATERKRAKIPGSSHRDWLEAASEDLVTVKTAMQPGVVNQTLIEKLGAILSIGDSSLRNPQWQTVLLGMRAEDAAAVRELFRVKARDGRHFQSEFEVFCHLWGQVDGSAAAPSLVGEYAGSPQIVSKVMQGWGSRDAAAALLWAGQQPSNTRDTIIGAIVEGLGQRSAREAEALILANQDNPAYERFQGRIAALMVAQQGLSGTLPWFDQIASSEVPEKFKAANLETLLKIMDQGADSGPRLQLARKYADRAWLPGSAGGAIGLDYLGEDPSSSLDRIGNMRSRTAQTEAARVVLGQWGPESTSEWLVAHPEHPMFDTGALQLVRALAKTDPEAAAAWAGQIKDSEMLSFANLFLKTESDRRLLFRP